MESPAMNDGTDEMEISKTGEVSSEEALSNLMAALAGGARAVQGLPLEDEFEYQSSFPEFQSLVSENQDDLLSTIVLALSVGDDKLDPLMGQNNGAEEYQSLADPLLWEACGDLCEWLLEQAEASTAEPKLQNNLTTARNQAKTAFGRLMQGLVDMEKPQDAFKLYTKQQCLTKEDNTEKKRNGRLEPFVPSIREKFHATKAPLNLTPAQGHGLQDRFGKWRPAKSFPTNSIIAPSEHIPHVYQEEIESLKFDEWQLMSSKTRPPKIKAATEPLSATWVDNPQTLERMVERLEGAREIAVDLEAHSYRTFAGLTCLIQITVGTTDKSRAPSNFLIDPFPLWNKLGTALGPILSNPKVVKVMHGAESDVQWLQRDFGLYIVNLFDTFCAAKALQLQRLGYAHLLQTYVGITADKSHQLSDWRQRPLPSAMKEYAIMDTHYLLDIYEHLRFDLNHHKEASIADVLDKSRQVCLIRYAPEPFRPEGYQTLLKRRGSKTELNIRQQQVLKELWDWRDQVARQCDESLFYVCSNNALVRLALACPTTLTALQGLLQPMPPLVLKYAKQILGFVQRSTKSPFFKPASYGTEENTLDASNKSRALMSPVLGTEALYRQAGWISPHIDEKLSPDQVVIDVVPTSTDEEEGDEGDLKSRRMLAVHEANSKYRSSSFTSHSLQLGRGQDNVDTADAGMVDGMGAARALHQSDMEQEARIAKTTASRIRNAQERHPMYSLISPNTDLDEDYQDDEEEEDEEEKTNEEDFVIPRSMREIYRISNRNRRKKKSLSPQSIEPNAKEGQELSLAEEVLKSRSFGGKNYFDEIPGTPKRQRTKSTGTASLSSEEAGVGHDSGTSREEDIAVMQEIGWIKDRIEIESMLKQRDSAGEGEEDGDAASSEEEGMKQPKPFDYSSVGSIGAFSAAPSTNPFFAGAATAGGHLNQQFGKSDAKRKSNSGRGKQSRRPQQQVERPERTQGRAQAYKKR